MGSAIDVGPVPALAFLTCWTDPLEVVTASTRPVYLELSGFTLIPLLPPPLASGFPRFYKSC